MHVYYKKENHLYIHNGVTFLLAGKHFNVAVLRYPNNLKYFNISTIFKLIYNILTTMSIFCNFNISTIFKLIYNILTTMSIFCNIIFTWLG